jgi:hypothetical protein
MENQTQRIHTVVVGAGQDGRLHQGGLRLPEIAGVLAVLSPLRIAA